MCWFATLTSTTPSLDQFFDALVGGGVGWW
jgi:hypothetical protein